MCCLRVMHLADENRAVVTSLVLVDFPAGLESSLRLLLASRGTRQGQHYRLLVISSNLDRRQTAHARTALTASACLVWVLLRASWFSALSVKILFLFSKSVRAEAASNNSPPVLARALPNDIAELSDQDDHRPRRTRLRSDVSVQMK